MFFIKIRVKNTLKNHREKTESLIETLAIKNKDKISYCYDNTTHKIIELDNKIMLIRETQEFIHKFIFELDNITKSEYYIKELNTSIDVLIKTTKLNKSENQILIEYEIIDSGDYYSFILDME